MLIRSKPSGPRIEGGPELYASPPYDPVLERELRRPGAEMNSRPEQDYRQYTAPVSRTGFSRERSFEDRLKRLFGRQYELRRNRRLERWQVWQRRTPDDHQLLMTCSWPDTTPRPLDNRLVADLAMMNPNFTSPRKLAGLIEESYARDWRQKEDKLVEAYAETAVTVADAQQRRVLSTPGTTPQHGPSMRRKKIYFT